VNNWRRIQLMLMFLLLPALLNYFSPYLIIDGAAHGIMAGAFFIRAFMFLLSLVAGRTFCSYICPYGGLQMLIDKMINKPLKDIKWLRWFKLVLGVLWVGAFVYVLLLQGGFTSIDFFYLTEKYVSVDAWEHIVLYYVIIFGLGILPFILGRRASCHYLCPMSILNIVGTKIKNGLPYPSLRLVANPSKCSGCQQCNKTCPMSLDVSNMVRENDLNKMECILCGECTKTCKFGAVERKLVKL
jgi:ferredoxin-type protein NapH